MGTSAMTIVESIVAAKRCIVEKSDLAEGKVNKNFTKENKEIRLGKDL